MRKFLFLLFLLCIALSASGGTYFWDDGEIVRGGEKLNNALGEKADRGLIILGTYSGVTASNSITIPVTTSYVRIADNATDSTNLLSIAAGSDGQIIYIYNGDASSTSGVATITTLHVGSVLYASGSWRLLTDE